MLEAGAKGETARELQEAVFGGADAGAVQQALQARLAAWNKTRSDVTLTMARRAFVDAGLTLRPEWVTTLQGIHGDALTLDLQAPSATATLDHWVQEATRGLIPSAIPKSGVGGARLIALDALYFKGKWAYPFAMAATHQADFTLASGEVVKVPTMHQVFKHGRYRKLSADSAMPEVELVSLPYKGKQIWMHLVLPARGSTVSQVEAALSDTVLDTWNHAAYAALLKLWVPKFAVASTEPRSLKAALLSTGVRRAFDDTADFSGISTPGSANPGLNLDGVWQSVRLKVDEEGTVVAVATIAKMQPPGGPDIPRPVELHIDRPFLFVIQHRETGAVMLMGHIGDPRAK